MVLASVTSVTSEAVGGHGSCRLYGIDLYGLCPLRLLEATEVGGCMVLTSVTSEAVGGHGGCRLY